MGLTSVALLDLVQALRSGAPSDASESCAELLRRFEPLFRKHWLKIQSTVQPTGVAYEDFVQEIAARMIRYLQSLENLRAFPGYLQSIVATTAVELIKQANRQIPDDTLRDTIADAYAETAEMVVLRSYFDKLPAREAYLLEMNVVHGVETEECARRLNLSASAVRTLKSRAIRRLRAIVNEEEAILTKL